MSRRQLSHAGSIRNQTEERRRIAYHDEIIKLNLDYVVGTLRYAEREVQEGKTVQWLLDAQTIDPTLFGSKADMRDFLGDALAMAQDTRKPAGIKPEFRASKVTPEEFKEMDLVDDEEDVETESEEDDGKDSDLNGDDGTEDSGGQNSSTGSTGNGNSADDSDDGDEYTEEGDRARTSKAQKKSKRSANKDGRVKKGKSSAAKQPNKNKLINTDPPWPCPVPNCQTGLWHQRKKIISHCREDHGIVIERYDGKGGNMRELGKRQEQEIRDWLQANNLRTDSPFFQT